MTTALKLPPVWLLVICVALGPFAMTSVVPANTQIMRDFATTYGVAQLLLTVYLLSMGIAQLFLGFLSDRFGRRPVMIAGLSVFTVGCLLAAVAPSLELLLASRIVQGIGISAGQSLSRATVRDVYPRDKAASVLGYISMAMVAVPMVGPIIGGLLTEHGSWRQIFLVTACAGAVTTLLVFRWMHETGGRSVATRPRFLPSSVALLKEPAFLGYTLSMTSGAGMFYSYQAGAPFLVLEVMQRTPTEYGSYFALTALGYFLGNFVSGRFSQRVGPDRMIVLALIPAWTGIVALWIFAQLNHPLALFLPLMCLTFSNGMTLPNAMSGVLSVRPKLAGTAAGLSGFVQVSCGALLSLITGFIQNGYYWPLLGVLTLCASLGVFGAIIGQRHRVEGA